MMTSEWFRTRQERIERRIAKARQTDRFLSVNDVWQAFREVTNDPPTETDVRIVAQAFGCLTLGEVSSLVDEVSRGLRNECDNAAAHSHRLIEELRKSMAEPTASEMFWHQTVREVRRSGDQAPWGLVPRALMLQALVWALSPPKEQDDQPVY